MTSDSAPWAVEVINFYMKVHAEMAPDSLVKARGDTCKGCEHFGKVEIPGALVDGCKVCGCPLETKSKVIRFFHPVHLKMETSDCPQGLWPEINNFLT